MSNTIRRPRRRPRVESINFRALWWLVAIEAAYRVEVAWASFARGRTTDRSEFYARRWRSWRCRARRILGTYTSLRVLP